MSFAKLQLTSALVISAFTTSMVDAAPGFPDPTFGEGGKVITSFKWPGGLEGSTRAQDLAIQPDGKIVVGGTLQAGFVRPVLIRYNPDGTLDTTFGSGGGIMIANFDYSWATSMAIQSDGRIVVVGFQYRPTHSTEEYFVARFETNGWYDASFGVGGLLRIQMGGGAEDVAIQPDGKIVIVGGSSDGSVIVRLHPNGSFDTSFDGDGKALIPASASRIALQQDGKIVAAGSKDGQSMLARFTSAGQLDSSFDGDGIVITDVDWPKDNEKYNDVAIQPDGRIVAIGTGTDGVDEEFHYITFISRYQPTGELDNSFNGNGITQFVFYGAAPALVIQPNGKIVAGGYSGWGSILFRFNSDGSSDGHRWDRFGYSSGFGALALQPDGKIVAGGGSAEQYSSTGVLVARFSPGDLVVSGRVIAPNGTGLRNAVVTLTDSVGISRSVAASSLGFYSFDKIAVGESVTLTVSSRRYRFEPVTITMNESLSNVDLVGIE